MEAMFSLGMKRGLQELWALLYHAGMEVGLDVLLRTAWLAATLPILIALIPWHLLSSFRECLLGFAKRGKILQSSSNKFTVPQKFFCHFYLLAVVWTAFLLVITWSYAYNVAPMVSEPFHYSSIVSHLTGGSNIFYLRKSHSIVKQRYKVWVSVFLLSLMEVQALRRLFETIYVFKYSASARMHIFGYLTGLFFYAAAPLSLCCNFAPEAIKFAANYVAEFIVKGKNQMPALEVDWWGLLSPLVTLRWYSWIGMALFFWGWIHQCHCHLILGSLRDTVEEADSYVIPYGDWFEYVSSPHYLSEIVIYAGILVASGGADLTIWLLFVFVVVNLALAAAETHRWYLQKFENYPRNRCAIIPFVY
ncbi:Polyprenol reductase [Bertholletia excelsa]